MQIQSNATPHLALNEQSVREKAYQIWEKNGRPAGTAEQDWFDAIRALTEPARRTAASATPSPVAKQPVAPLPATPATTPAPQAAASRPSTPAPAKQPVARSAPKGKARNRKAS
jgi:hypothetical protein